MTFTPEDDLDVLDADLGRLRRRLSDCQRSLFDGRMTDSVERAANEKHLRSEIARLEHERAGILADHIAEAEGFAS